MLTIETDKIPAAHDGIALYLDAGWGTPADYEHATETYETAYHHCRFITAWTDDRLIGMIRYWTDTVHDTQIIECVVSSACRGQGVGRALLDRLKALYPTTALYVNATEKCQDFFLHEGFKKHRLIGLSYAAKPCTSGDTQAV